MAETLPLLSGLERVGKLSTWEFNREVKRISDLESLTIEQLAEQAIDPKKLILSEKFTVERALVESYPIHSSERNQGGYGSRVILDVKPDNKNCPINQLRFAGFSAIRTGEYILARIPVHIKIQRKDPITGFGYAETFYFPREQTTTESAIELSLLDNKENILRTERSADYNELPKRW